MRWPKVKLGEVLTKSQEWIPLHPDQKYREVTVRLWGKGAVLRQEIFGAEIASASRLRVRPDQFIISRIDARNGACALIPKELDGAVVSNDFPVFTPNPDRLDARYLGWRTKTKSFVALCTAASEGTTNRVRLKEDRFLLMEIDLPPLAEQRRLVACIDALAGKIDEAKRLREQVVGATRSMLLSAYTGMTSSCPTLAMREVAPQVRRPVDPLAGVEYHELGIRSFGKGSFHKPPLDGGSVGTKKLYEIHPGDVVFNNVFAWEGAVAVAKPEDAGRVGSHRFITCVPKPNVATAEYINFHFSTRLGLAQLGEASPGGAGRNRTLGLEALARIVIPVPPYAAQLWFGELLKKCQKTESERTTADAELSAMLPAILDRAFRGEL
jgi:type I restriction enzyme S subunit